MGPTEMGSTEPQDVGLATARRARKGRRAFLVVLAGIVLLGLTGTLGVSTETVRASGGGYQLAVSYASVNRAALASPWQIEVRREGGFPGDVILAVDATYLELFDWNTIVPVPAEERRAGNVLLWTFTEPPGEILRIALDARIGPAVQIGRDASVAVIEGGGPVVRVEFHTRVLP